uniref:Ig-like domain-containing protein n=1 Tax=Macrostomum lignano TaxID=282301 RepID=A0A1I8FB65_9PLAT
SNINNRIATDNLHSNHYKQHPNFLANRTSAPRPAPAAHQLGPSGHSGQPVPRDGPRPSRPAELSAAAKASTRACWARRSSPLIDTRRAGPGDLTARCVVQPSRPYCELYDHQNNTYTLSIKPQESGKQTSSSFEYNGDQARPSTASGRRLLNASRVHVYGPGVEHGVLDTFQSRFVCETKGAGAGQLTVRIRGPGAPSAWRWSASTERGPHNHCCRYDPCEPGEYQLHICSGLAATFPVTIRREHLQDGKRSWPPIWKGTLRGRRRRASNGAIFDF